MQVVNKYQDADENIRGLDSIIYNTNVEQNIGGTIMDMDIEFITGGANNDIDVKIHANVEVDTYKSRRSDESIKD